MTSFFRLGSPSESMETYAVSGRWQSRDGWQPFETEVDAENEDVAVERTYAEFGSRHGLTRTQVEVEGVRAATEADA